MILKIGSPLFTVYGKEYAGTNGESFESIFRISSPP